MELSFNPRAERPSRWGDVAVIGFVLVQCLDGVFTYLGISLWGRSVEGNPLVSAIVGNVGLAAGLTGAKLIAVGFGILLHLKHAHHLVAFLTAVYLAIAILPWTAIFLSQ